MLLVGANGNVFFGPNTWQCVSQEPDGRASVGLARIGKEGRLALAQRSTALLVMRRFPEQLLPVVELRLHAADAIEESREVRDTLRP